MQCKSVKKESMTATCVLPPLSETEEAQLRDEMRAEARSAVRELRERVEQRKQLKASLLVRLRRASMRAFVTGYLTTLDHFMTTPQFAKMPPLPAAKPGAAHLALRIGSGSGVRFR